MNNTNSTLPADLNSTAAKLQDAFHYALMAKGGKARGWSTFDGDGYYADHTTDAFLVMAYEAATRAGMPLKHNYTKRTLAGMIAAWGASQSINAYRGTVCPNASVEAIMSDCVGNACK